MKLIKKISLLAIVGAMTLQMVACSDKGKDPKDNGNEGKTKYEVTMDEFNFTLEKNILQYQEQYKEQWDKLKDDENVKKRIEEIALEQIILDKVLANEANLANTKVTNREVDTEYDRIKTEYAKTGDFNEFLTKNNLTEESYKQNIKNQFLVNYFLKAKAEEITKTNPSASELEEFYKKNINALKQIRASHILVATEEEAKDVKKKLDEGEKFEDLAMDISTCPSSTSGGDLGYFKADEMVAEFSNAAFSMDIGQISEPVKSEFGYHIIKLVDIIDTFDKADKEDVLNQYRTLTYTKMLTDYIDNADVNMPEELVKIRERTKNSN